MTEIIINDYVIKERIAMIRTAALTTSGFFDGVALKRKRQRERERRETSMNCPIN